MRHRPLTGKLSRAWATRTAHPALIGPPTKITPDKPVGPLDPGINQRPARGSPVCDVGAKPRGRHRLTRSICARGCACPLRAWSVLMLISQGHRPPGPRSPDCKPGEAPQGRGAERPRWSCTPYDVRPVASSRPGFSPRRKKVCPGWAYLPCTLSSAPRAARVSVYRASV